MREGRGVDGSRDARARRSRKSRTEGRPCEKVEERGRDRRVEENWKKVVESCGDVDREQSLLGRDRKNVGVRVGAWTVRRCAEQNVSPKNLSCVTQRLDMPAMYAVRQLRAQGQDNLLRSSEDKREETEPAAAKSSFAAGEGGRNVMDWTLTDNLELCARP